MLRFELKDLAATAALAKRLSQSVRAGDVTALQGGLGAGKTTFARAFISALMGETTDVPSPTYTLVQSYDAPEFPIFHFDLYRLESPDEVYELGWDETQAHSASYDAEMTADLFCEVVNRYQDIYAQALENAPPQP